MLEKLKALAATTCVAATAIVSVATQASAATLYTLTPGTSSDGGTISGSFDYDASSQNYSNIAINTSGGNTTTFPPTAYTSYESFVSDNSNLQAATSSSSFYPGVQLSFNNRLTGQPGDTTTTFIASENNSSGQNSRSFSGVTVTSAAAAVPEPDGTSGIGLAILGGGGWLVKRKIAPSIKAKALSIQ